MNLARARLHLTSSVLLSLLASLVPVYATAEARPRTQCAFSVIDRLWKGDSELPSSRNAVIPLCSRLKCDPGFRTFVPGCSPGQGALWPASPKEGDLLAMTKP